MKLFLSFRKAEKRKMQGKMATILPNPLKEHG